MKEITFFVATAIASLATTANADVIRESLVSGRTVAGYIATPGEKDTYTFYAVAGQSIELSVGPTASADGLPRPGFVVYDQSGSQVARDGHATHSGAWTSFSTTLTGVYTVVVSDQASISYGNTGAYLLQFASIPGESEHGILGNDQHRKGWLARGDMDSYTLFANSGDSIELQVANEDLDGGIAYRPLTRVYDPKGNLVNVFWDYGVSGSSFHAEITGSYTAIVRDNSGRYEFGNYYSIYFARAPGANEHGRLINGGRRHEYTNWGDIDTFTFYASAGENISLSVHNESNLGGIGFKPGFVLYDPTGNALTSLFEWVSGTQAINASVSGIYTVVVRDNSSGHDGIGQYSIGLQIDRSELSYAALGDSFSSGEGLYPYQNKNDWHLTIPDPLSTLGISVEQLGIDGGCHRSDLAYSSQIRRPGELVPLVKQENTQFDFFACTGATTNNVRIDGEPLHGQPTQISPDNAIDNKRDLITISIGGNDAYFVPIVAYCLAMQDCVDHQPFGHYSELSLRELAPLFVAKSGFLVREVHQQLRDAATNATIAVFGYPILLSGNECGAVVLPGSPNDKLSADEQAFLRQLNKDLNSVVSVSALSTGLHFISVEEGFENHEICDPAENWVNGIDLFNPAASFHPTARGQTEYANAFNAYMRSIAIGWPNGYSEWGLPRNPTPIPALTAQAQGATTELPRFGPLSVKLVALPDDCHTADNVLVPGQSVRLIGTGFAPLESVQLSLMTDGKRTDLGLGSADADGVFLQEVLLPEDLVPGTSGSVHVLGGGENGAGLLLLSIYRVEASTTLDGDSDGVLDLCDNCSAVPNEDQRDTDRDGYGNMCDADFDNNGIVNTFDLARFKAAFGTSGDIDADLDGNFVVNTFDLARFKSLFGQKPGPAFGR